MNLFFKNKTKSRGETILEVLLAVAALTMVLTAAFTVLSRATATNQNIKNRIIALNLAREATEAVRNVRDTNWLKYSGERREKWLCQDSNISTSACQGDVSTTMPTIADGTYSVEFDDANTRYYLILRDDDTVIDPASSLGDSPSFEDKYALFVQDSNGRLASNSLDASGTTRLVQSPFFRQVRLKIENNPVCGSNNCIETKLIVAVYIYWREDNGQVQSLSTETHLFDFFDRDSY